MLTRFLHQQVLTLTVMLFSLPAVALTSGEMDSIIKPLMQQHHIPGMAVAVSDGGKNHFYNYGVTSKQSGNAVTEQTLFEIGSLSKTFTATLASYAQQQGKIDLTTPVAHYLPILRGSAFDHVTLQNLATHTSGLPLQIPDNIRTKPQLMNWYRHWQPSFMAGTQRIYSNPGIGLLGLISARQLQQPFNTLMEKKLLPALGLKHTWINVPPAEMGNYAQGYNKEDRPVRVNPGMLDAEAYGIKSSSADLIRFLQINLGTLHVADKWQNAIQGTQRGYYQVGGFVQDMMWEHYPWPTHLATLLGGNDSTILTQSQKVSALYPMQPPQRTALYNKTGSTNGFSTYALFIPSRNVAIILLANKSYPNPARIESAWKILQTLEN